MPLVFPSLPGGILTQRYAVTRSYSTAKVEMECGVTYTYARRSSPIESWTLSYDLITDEELALLEEFFAVAEGRLHEFSFTDANAHTHPKCRFDTDEFTASYLGPNQNAVSLPLTEDR